MFLKRNLTVPQIQRTSVIVNLCRTPQRIRYNDGWLYLFLEFVFTGLQLLGMEECQKRISEMVKEAKCKVKMPLQKPLNALVSGATILSCVMFMVEW
jgi:hypothetical protein